MELIVVFIVALGLGVIMGIRASDLFHKHMLAQILQDLGIKPEQMRDLERKLAAELGEEVKDTDSEVIRVVLEQHQGTLFAYRESDQQFLGQGANREDLIKSIGSRLRGVTIEITNGELLQKNNG